MVELRCTYDPATRGGDAPDGRKVKATIHWVSAAHAAAGGGAALRPPLRRARPGRRRGRLPRGPQPDSLEVLTGCQDRAGAGRRRRRAAAASSSAWATSAVDPRFHARPARSSTARSPSATAGPGCSSRGEGRRILTRRRRPRACLRSWSWAGWWRSGRSRSTCTCRPCPRSRASSPAPMPRCSSRSAPSCSVSAPVSSCSGRSRTGSAGGPSWPRA